MNYGVKVVGPVLPVALGEIVKAAFAQDDFSVLVETLECVLEVKADGLLIYGSRSQKSHRVDFGSSDVDLLLLVDQPLTGGVFGRAGDVEIDLHLASRKFALSDDPRQWALYANGRVVFDRRPPEIGSWLQSLQVWREANSNPWTSAEIIKDRAWAERLIARLVRAGPNGDPENILHEARFLAALPTLYAQARGRHPTSITKWWEGLRSEDRDFAEALESYLLGRSGVVDIMGIVELIKLLYDPRSTAGEH